MRKIAEGANDLRRSIDGQSTNYSLQLLPRLLVGVAMETDRDLADLFDHPKNLLAFVQAYRVSEDASEQPDIIAQWCVLIRGLSSGKKLHLRLHWLKLQELIFNSSSPGPQNVKSYSRRLHPSACYGIDPRPPRFSPCFPLPISSEAHTMPTQDRLGLNHLGCGFWCGDENAARSQRLRISTRPAVGYTDSASKDAANRSGARVRTPFSRMLLRVIISAASSGD